MEHVISANGLTLIKVSSYLQCFTLTQKGRENFEEAISLILNRGVPETLIVAYMDFGILIGRYNNGKIDFYNKQILEMNFLQRIRILMRKKNYSFGERIMVLMEE